MRTGIHQPHGKVDIADNLGISVREKWTVADKNNKAYGVKVELPDNDPFRMPHLLGDEWTGTRWFATAAERDVAMAGIVKQPGNYRRGDTPSILVSAIDP